MERKNINTVSLFSGGGGLDLGFSISGFNIIYASDIDKYSCKTLEINQGKKEFLNKHIVECADVKELTADRIKSKVKGNIDFVIGGPPCQSFSVFGKRKGLDDPRGNLVYEYIRLIKELNPTGFLFENVKGLRTINNGKVFDGILSELSINGTYKVSAHEYELAEFGVPQFRRRVFFIGTKTSNKVPAMEATHTSPNSLFNAHKPYSTVSKALSNLPKPIVGWKGNPPINAHVGRNHSERIKERYESLEFGQRDHKTRINKLYPDKPSYTIIVGSDQGGGKGHVHPYEPREVTPRESARIQTFPDWWEFAGSGRHVIRQVGNAVPPLFGAIIGSHIAKHIFEVEKTIGYDSILKRLDLEYL